MRIILASGSPRRFQLLKGLGYDVHVISPDIDETPLSNEGPREMVMRLATLKANAIALSNIDSHCPIVAADTTVYCENRMLGKPTDEQDAVNILNFLSDKEQEVITGYCIKQGDHEQVDAVSTHIRFRALSQIEIMNYVATGECLDKAGAYGIQGFGAGLVSYFSGSYTNVIGLPLEQILLALDAVGK